MTVDEFVPVTVDRLANCRDRDQFQAVIDDAIATLADSDINKESRERFWKQVAEKYWKAPRLLLKEAAAAEKLFLLMQAAEAMLANAATK